MVTVMDNVLTLLADFGFFRVVLPFLLIFAVFYAILLKTGVLGKESEAWTKRVSAVVSFVAAFLVISYTPVVDALQTLIPQASFLIVVVMLLLLLLGFMGIKTENFLGEPKWYVGVIALVFVIIFLGLIDYATGFQIPVIHSLTKAIVGSQGVSTGSSETSNTLLGVEIVLGIPLLVVGLIMWSSKSSK